MALYSGYAEVVRVGSAPQRFLLELDATPISPPPLPGAPPPPPPPVNYLDLDAALPGPDLAIALILRRYSSTEKLLEINLKPMPGRTIVGTEVHVYITDSVLGVFPTNTLLPEPASFAYFAYVGGPGHEMPELSGWLGQKVIGDTAHQPIDEATVAVSTQVTTQPFGIAFGRMKGPIVLGTAHETTSDASGTPATEVTIRTIDPATAPDGMVGRIDLTRAGMVPFPAGGLRLLIRTPHATERPLGAPAATLAAAGAGSIAPGRRRYKVTYVCENENETGASDPSDVVEVVAPASDGKIRLTGLPIGPLPLPGDDAKYAVTKRRLYRTLASADGDSGEYFFVKEVDDNSRTTIIDDTMEEALGAPLPAHVEVDYCGTNSFALSGWLRMRDRGVQDTYYALLAGVPKEAKIIYRSVPAPDPMPRVTWHASDVLTSATITVAGLRGETRFAELHVHNLAQAVGVHWLLRGDDRAWLAVGDRRLLALDPPIDGLAALLSSEPRSWRDAPQTICFEQVEKRFDGGVLERSRTRVSARGLKRIEVKTGEAGKYARAGNGIIVDLQLGADPGPWPAREQRPIVERSLRLLRLLDRPGKKGREHSHLALRAGVLPDQIQLDVGPPDASGPDSETFGGYLHGKLGRLKVLALEHPTSGADSWAADQQRVWLTMPDTGQEIDVFHAPETTTVLDTGEVQRTPAATVLKVLPALFAEVSLRNPDGLGDGVNPLQRVKAGVLLPRLVHAETSTDALSLCTDAQGDRVGISGRIALSTELDRLLATRSNPQIKLRRTAVCGIVPTLHALTARILGVTSLGLKTADGAPFDLRVMLDPARVNRSLRAAVRELDLCFAPLERDLGWLRVSFVPGDLHAIVDGNHGVFELRLDAPSGEGSFWLEPSKVRDSGQFEHFPAGIGLVSGRFDPLPRALRLSVIDADTLLPIAERAPPNWTPPASWRRSGLKLELSENGALRFVRAVAWSRDLFDPDAPFDRAQATTFWTRTDLTFFQWQQTDPTTAPDAARLDPVWIWTPSAEPPAFKGSGLTGTTLPKPDAGFAIRIDPMLRLSVDADLLEKETASFVGRWNALGGLWKLAQELQMKDYQGEVSVASQIGLLDGYTEGDTGAGPGRWLLRVLHQFFPPITSSSIYFGNTGGTPASRPRIYT